MSITVIVPPTNMTGEQYDEVISRLETAGAVPHPDGSTTLASVRQANSESSMCGVRWKSSRRLARL